MLPGWRCRSVILLPCETNQWFCICCCDLSLINLELTITVWHRLLLGIGHWSKAGSSLMPGTTTTETRKINLGESARYASKSPVSFTDDSIDTHPSCFIFLCYGRHQARHLLITLHSSVSRPAPCDLLQWTSARLQLCGRFAAFTISLILICPGCETVRGLCGLILQCILLKHIHFNLL